MHEFRHSFGVVRRTRMDEEPAFQRYLLLGVYIPLVRQIGFGAHDIIQRIRSEHFALMLNVVLASICVVER